MRFVIATVLLVLSGLSILVGFAIKGPFDANNFHKVDFAVKSNYAYLVIPHDTLTAFDGDVTVQATGTKEIFYADARERDIQDWIGSSNFVRLNLNPSTKKPDISEITASGINANPEGSDMWRTSIKVKNSLLAQVNMFEDTGVLLASNGFATAPNKVSLSWQVANLINWPLVLIYSGLGLLVLALIANYLAFRQIRKLRGPKRRIPKAPRGPRYRKRIRPDVPKKGRRRLGRNMVVAPASLITLTLLTGCSPASTSTEQQAQAKFPEVKVVVTDNQLQRIVREVAATVKQADTNRDEATLVTRVTGPALETRKIQYLLQVKSKKIPKLPDIVANPVTIALPMQLPAAELGWQPRVIMAVTKADSNTRAPQMLVLEQASPRDNYKLWYLIDLLPSVKFPDVAPQDVGALAVDTESTYLATALKSLPFKYGDLLNKTSTSKYLNEFDLRTDKFYSSVSALQTQQKADLKKVKVSIKFVHTLGDPNILGMFTRSNGGLIAISMDDTSVIKPQVRGSAVSVTQVDHKILLNAAGSSTGLKIVYRNMLLFYVPVAGSDERIRLVGASQGILSVKAIE